MRSAALSGLLFTFCVFSGAIAAILPVTNDQSSNLPWAVSSQESHVEAGGYLPSHKPRALAKRAPLLRSLHCEVPGTDIVLLINLGSRKVLPHGMAEVLLQTHKFIRRKLREAGGDRPLVPDELPFESIAWGVKILAWPAPDAEDPQRVLLTWQQLYDTIEGLFKCVYNKKMFFELQAMINTKVGVTLDSKGTLDLTNMFGPRDTAR
ncbi:MAG: hypothetical protein Q9225_006443 [Loekoesia sp. 1 TL-2023]